MTSRRIFKLTGQDVDDFLQGLVTNDVSKLDQGMLYTALLTPQGKLIADFFLVRVGDAVLLDVAEDFADALATRLNMYKLRADVQIQPTTLNLHRGTSPAPSDAFSDPRHPDLGWRAYRDEPEADDGSDWDAIRVANCIPESGVELTPETYILEAGFEALNGVDFKKGCYVGQEVTARMKHKTELRKGLELVKVDGPLPAGTDITSDGKPAGTLFTQSGNHGIAYLRKDRAKGELLADGVKLRWLNPA